MPVSRARAPWWTLWRTRWRGLGRWCLLLAALLPGCVSAAARRQGIVGTRLLRWGVASRVEVQHERTDRRAQQAQRQRMVTAGFDVDADISVYDPRLLEATIAATIAQSHAKARGPVDGTDTASVPRYYFRAQAFRDHTISGHVLAERDDDRSFSRARFIRSSIEREEAGVVARSPEWRGYVTVRRSTSDIRGIDSLGDRTIDGKFLSAGGEHSDGRSRTTVDLKLADLDEEPSGRDDRTRQIDILNTYRMKTGGTFPEFRFRTGAQFWRQRTPDDTQQREQYFEDVTVDLSDDFTSRTNLEYRKFSNGFDTKNRTFRQEFTHRFYDSLATTVGGFTSRDDFDDGQTDRTGYDASLDYRKDVPLGTLSAGVDMAVERQDDRFDGDVRPVFGESVLLATARSSFLKQPNVVHSTVLVRDGTGVITYVKGVDYDLARRGSFTEIRRIPTGLIPDGAVVRVDYEFESSGDLKFETRTQTTRMGYRVLDTVSLYTRKTRRRQDALRGDPTNQLQDSDRTIYGAEFDWGNLRLTGEKERYASDFSPFKERRGSASYDYDLDDQTRLGVFTTQSRTEFEEGEDLRIRSYGGTLTYMPARGLRVEAQPVWQEERGRSDDLDILDVRVKASYSIGRIDLELLVDHRQVARGNSRESDTRIIFSVVREW